MKKIYNIKNVHCADCARSLEEAISGMKGVERARLNFLTEKLELETKDDCFDDVLQDVKKLIRDFSKDVEFYEQAEEASQRGETGALKFKLVGLSCPNCFEKIENSVSKLKDVERVKINLASGEMMVETKVVPSQVLINRIKSLINSIEPNIKAKEEKVKSEPSKIGLKEVLYCIGLALAVPIFLEALQMVVLPTWARYSLVVLSAVAMGYSTYLTAFKMLLRLNINENLLVTISVVGAIAIGETTEGLMVVALYTLGKMLEAKAVNKSRKSIQALLDISPESTVVIRDGMEQRLHPKEVQVGEIIKVCPGEKVALDGKIISGHCNIDAQSLTGESKPITKSAGDDVLAGVVVLDGVLEIKVEKRLAESTTTKIMNLIEKASENKSKTETFISRFSKYYTLIVVALAITVGVITGLVLGDWTTALYRGLIFLVISCPCAFAISVPLTYFSGIGNASQKGILIKGSNYLDACAKAKMVAFDKTGTLTTGEFNISNIEVLEDAYTAEEILELAGIGEQNSIHPLAKCIVKTLNKNNLPKPENYKEIAGTGITFDYEDTNYFVGRREDNSDKTEVVVKKGNVLLGIISFEDGLKQTSELTIKGLREMRVDTAMLTGDKAEVAQIMAEKLNGIAVHSEMLPQDKYKWIEEYKNTNGRLIYVGDGINDAPSLALADVGVSMGINGSGASIEASDVVLVDDDPLKTVDLIKISKYTKKIVLQNIIFAGVIKVACLALGAVGITKMFMAVFADVGVTILAVLNSLRALKYDTKRNKNLKNN